MSQIIEMVVTECPRCGRINQGSLITWERFGWLREDHDEWCGKCEEFYTAQPPPIGGEE